MSNSDYQLIKDNVMGTLYLSDLNNEWARTLDYYENGLIDEVQHGELQDLIMEKQTSLLREKPTPTPPEQEISR